LPGYDYAQAGAYFITICAQNRECRFGDIDHGAMRLNDEGCIIEEEWKKTTKLRPNVGLDEFVIMPNHVHGIVIIIDARRGTARRAPTNTTEQFGKPVPGSVPTIVRSFKSVTAKRINELRGTSGARIWQRNYYEHIIHNDDEWHLIREYTVNNPQQWALDRENPVGANNHSPRKGNEPWHV
jgi:REP element-mobilizing transposase RayT